ncbi:MAG: hypothetical protein LBK60_04255 [Verrucomicrobiales bacterium]|nr:hypothetical protein [Verrucomicrobiales bacterium]
MHGDFADGLFPGLPWFLDDLHPQGFLGRLFARQHGRELGADSDPRLWTDAQVLATLLRHGHDLSGDLVLGDSALSVALGAPTTPEFSADSDRLPLFGRLSAAALQGDLPGSSAAGEQPKFTCRQRLRNGRARHWLVKFSPPLDTPHGQRWADLLVCEQITGEILRQYKVPAAQSEWLADG